jgi:hypothetical protein
VTMADKRSAAVSPAPSIGPAQSKDERFSALESRVNAPQRAEAKAPAERADRKADAPAERREGVRDLPKAKAIAAPVPPPAPLPRAAPPAAAQAEADSARTRSAVMDFASRADIASPDPAVRWRVGSGGLVRRSIDGGITWLDQPSGSTADLLAGSAPSSVICWIAGRAGTVLLSVDGRTWQPRPFPEAADLIAVSAADAKTAAVTTSDGRRFSTTDAGLTWLREPLQEFQTAPF